MTYEIRELLQLNVEMEGLLRVLAERENPHALDALAVKAADFDAKVRAFLDAARPEIVKEDEAEAAEMPDSFDAVGADTPDEEDVLTTETPATAPEAVSAEEPEMPVTTVTRTPAAAPGSTRPRVDLTKAFSLNDRYLYSRELFGGSMQAFQEALAGMSKLPDFAHAIEYMTDTLGLDLSQPAAKDFADRVADNLPKR